LCACASTASPDRAPIAAPTSAKPSGDSFFAVVPSKGGAIAELSAESGKVTHRIAPSERDGKAATGLSRLSPDTLLVTYSVGPACTSNLAGCGPQPNTCGAEVDALNIHTGAVEVLWRVGLDQRLAAAQASPDGTMIAALASPCVPFYFNNHLVVRRLHDGVTWRIGNEVARCHVLSAPQWTADSAHLLVTYAPPTGTTPYTGEDGTCTSTGDRSIVKVDALHPQPLLTGIQAAPQTKCTFEAVATDRSATYAVQACGRDDYRSHGPVAMVRLDQDLHTAQSWPLGTCGNGSAGLAADPAKGVLVAAYLYCADSLGPKELPNPITALDRLDGTKLRRLAAVHSGETPFGYLTW
jgi:hypothetical protein